MTRIVRRVVALLGATALGLTATPMAMADESASPIPDGGLIGSWEFNQTTGAQVPNLGSGSEPAQVINQSDSQWTGSSLTFTGGSKNSSGNWVRLPDNMLTGADSATISTEVRIDASMKSSYNFLWNIGGENNTTGYWFISVRDAARTAITVSSNPGEVNAHSGANLDPNRWYSLTSVIDGDAGTISFYLDGVLAGQANTSLKPSSITDQAMNTIGRAPWPDPLFKGEISTFRVWDRALDAAEVEAVSTADAELHADELAAAAQGLLAGIQPIRLTDDAQQLPDHGGVITWSSDDPAVQIEGNTALSDLPPTGETQVMLTATADVRGQTASVEVPATLVAKPGADDPYGYLLVHFIEDSAGYAEKIYLDVSRGDNPEQWDPLNGGEPILASHLGTTGIRDPYLTRNPDTGTWYIVATDLRVFGGDRGTPGCMEWCHWSSQGSVMLNIWESTDLVNWSDLRQIDVTLDLDGVPQAEIGMAWAPETTWVPDYFAEGEGAFVVYWSSNLYTDADHTGSSYARVMWGATTDFTQDTWDHGGVMIDTGGNAIDTSVIQHDGTTYRVTKDNAFGTGIYMEKSDSATWWLADTDWELIQTRIGASHAGGNAGGVEGPAMFKRNDSDHWYLYVDVIPTVGYRPLETSDLDAGWTVLSSPDFYMAPSTKHGGIVNLTRAEYDTVRQADAVAAVETHLGQFEFDADVSQADILAALPTTVEVELAYNRGTAELPVAWELDGATWAGTHEVTGVVQSIGANLNDWVGAGGSTDWNADDRQPRSSTAIEVTATLEVAEAAPGLELDVSTRCVAGKVMVVAKVINPGDEPVTGQLTSPWGSKQVTVAPGRSLSSALATRVVHLTDGEVSFDGLVVAPAETICG